MLNVILGPYKTWSKRFFFFCFYAHKSITDKIHRLSATDFRLKIVDTKGRIVLLISGTLKHSEDTEYLKL